MSKFDKPSKYNAVSISIYLALAAGVYGAVMFGPSYYRKWKVKAVLDDAAHAYYPKRRLPGANLAMMVDALRKRTIGQLRNDVGVKDPGIRLRFERSGDVLVVRAEYKERINHPLIKKTTVLSFRPYVTLSMKNRD